MTMKTQHLIATGLIVATSTLILSGCENMQSSKLDESFGSSVKSMIANQTKDSSLIPSEEPLESTDSRRLNNALRTYRDDVAEKGAVDASTDISIE